MIKRLLTLTGALTLAALSVLVFSPSARVRAQAIAGQLMTNGQILIGSTGAAPVAASLGASNGIAATAGAGSLSIGLSPTPTAAQVQSSGGTLSVLASACGATEQISATGAITLSGTTPVSAGTGMNTPCEVRLLNAGAVNITIPTTAGVTELAGGTGVVVQPYGTLILNTTGQNAPWVEMAGSPTN